jgi:hypothetical protein
MMLRAACIAFGSTSEDFEMQGDSLMKFTSTRNRTMTRLYRLAISLYMTVVSVSLLRGDSASELDQSEHEVLCKSDGRRVYNGLTQNNYVKTVGEIPPDYTAAVFPSLAAEALASLSPSLRIPIHKGDWAFSDNHPSRSAFENTANPNLQLQSFLHRPAEWNVNPMDQRRPKLNMFWESPIRYAGSTASSKRQGWLARMLGHGETVSTQSSPLGIVGWPTR